MTETLLLALWSQLHAQLCHGRQESRVPVAPALVANGQVFVKTLFLLTNVSRRLNLTN